MNKLWKNHPSLQIMIQSYLGINSSENKMSKQAKEAKGKIVNIDFSKLEWSKGA